MPFAGVILLFKILQHSHSPDSVQLEKPMNKPVSTVSSSFFSNLSDLDKMLALWALSLGYLPVFTLLLMTVGK